MGQYPVDPAILWSVLNGFHAKIVGCQVGGLHDTPDYLRYMNRIVKLSTDTDYLFNYATLWRKFL